VICDLKSEFKRIKILIFASQVQLLPLIFHVKLAPLNLQYLFDQFFHYWPTGLSGVIELGKSELIS
jgi:hypothetical protein